MTTKQRAVRLALRILLDPHQQHQMRLYDEALLRVASNDEAELSPREVAIQILTDAICRSGSFSNNLPDFSQPAQR